MLALAPWVEVLINLYLLNPSPSTIDDKTILCFKPTPFLGVPLNADDYDKAAGNHPIRPMLPDYCMTCGTDYGAIPNGRLAWNCSNCKSNHFINDKHYNLKMLSTSLGITEIMLTWLALNLLAKQLEGNNHANT